MLRQSLPSLILILGVAVAVPAKEKRVHRHSDLSDHAHDDSTGFHYDHEAFLDKEEAKTFDQLNPKESKDKLGKIVDRIDTDKDGFVSRGELHQWIKPRYYLCRFDDVDDKASYKAMLTRDERRFRTADRDGDGIATKVEFTAFLLPEEYDHMKTGTCSHLRMERVNQPDWVLMEKKHFTEFRDNNKDGFLDNHEVAQWILPGEIDHTDNEAKHLIHETDTDKLSCSVHPHPFTPLPL
ncbi:calumenin-like [Salvelinus alpinus]